MACNNTRMNPMQQRQGCGPCSAMDRMPDRMPERASLAVASVVMQPLGSETYCLDAAFLNGTIYPSLNKPFMGKGGCRS